jgi:anti-sigma B factor antagonist
VQIASRESQGSTILDVSGDIDLAHSPAMRKALLGEIRDKHTAKVFLNLNNVRYIDSSGIASLVEGLKASRDQGSRLILYGLSKNVREVMELSRLQKIFEIYDNEEQALAADVRK